MVQNSLNIVENKIKIDDEYLDSTLHEILLDGIRIFYVNHNVKKDRIYHSSGEYPKVQMQFALEGTNTAKSHLTGDYFKLPGMHHNLVYFPHAEVDYKIEGKKALFLGIQFTEDFFSGFIDEGSRLMSSFGEKIEKKEEAFLSREYNYVITPRMRVILCEIINSERKGYLKKLFLESKIIELFMIQAEQADLYNSNPFNIKKEDREKLLRAREFIEQNMLSEFTFGEVAYKAGLNEFKLKKGFREIFGNTVFGYLNDLRMEHAKQLILNEHKNISEVADLLGYSLPHHFSSAFKKKFGFAPGVLK